MGHRLRSDVRFIVGRHRPALLAVGCVAFLVVFLVASAAGLRHEIRKQLDQPIGGSTYRALARTALQGRDPSAEVDALLAGVFGTLVALNVLSAATVVSNTMLLVVEQRRPLLGRARALGAARAEIAHEVRLAGAIVCAGMALPAAALAWLVAAALNPTDVLHMRLEIGPPLLAAATGLFGLAGLLGSWLPARAAAAVDPWQALREPVGARPIAWPQLLVLAVSFCAAILFAALGTSGRDATLERFRALPILDQEAFDTLYGKADQSMTTFRVILLVLPLLSCASVVGSTVMLDARGEARRLALDRALGATRQHLYTRQLTRSVGLCLLAWMLAVPPALAIAQLLSAGLLPFSTTVPAWSLLVTLGFSGLAGVAGGLHPANATARLDPAELLGVSL